MNRGGFEVCYVILISKVWKYEKTYSREWVFFYWKKNNLYYKNNEFNLEYSDENMGMNW